MWRLTDALSIRAPSLYKHLPHKAALETAIIVDGFEEAAEAFEAATESASDSLAALAFIHGMVMLELNERFPPDDSTEPAWLSGIDAFRPSRKPPGHAVSRATSGGTLPRT